MGLFDSLTQGVKGLFSTGEGSPMNAPGAPQPEQLSRPALGATAPETDYSQLIQEPPGSEPLESRVASAQPSTVPTPSPERPQLTPDMSLSQRIGLVLIGAGAGMKGNFAAPFEMRMQMDKAALEKVKTEKALAKETRKEQAQNRIVQRLQDPTFQEQFLADPGSALIEHAGDMMIAGDIDAAINIAKLGADTRKGKVSQAAVIAAGEAYQRVLTPEGMPDPKLYNQELAKITDPETKAAFLKFQTQVGEAGKEQRLEKREAFQAQEREAREKFNLERDDKRWGRTVELFTQSQANIAARQDKMIAAMRLPSEVQGKISELNVLDAQLAEAKEKYKPEYVGPIKGRVGSLREVAGKMEPDEITFRKIIADAQDSLLRARSGAQINEQEYKRLLNFLPKVTSHENVFPTELARFQKQVALVRDEKVRAAGTSKTDPQSLIELSRPLGRSGEQTPTNIPSPPAGFRIIGQ